MTQPAFTPGPWHRLGAGIDATMVSTLNRNGRRVTFRVATCKDGDINTTSANGNLIAAAPDMYAALFNLDRMCRGVDWCDEDEQGRRWSAARAAIAKAEGRS